MKAVLISIQPKWCELIVSGNKTIEVRKNKPKLDTPFKCYIYCTAPKKFYKISEHMMTSMEYLHLCDGKVTMSDGFEFFGREDYEVLNCKVIGEFVCDRIETIECSSDAHNYYSKESCLLPNDFIKYCNGQDLYSWHISELHIYDKPKELSDFYKPCIDEEMQYCPCCKFGYEIYSSDEVECSADLPGSSFEQICLNRVKRPPQSWCYVKELEGTQ